MTITAERQAQMEVSIAYMNNKQVAVIRKEDKELYKSTADMKDAIIGAEDGSAGMSCVVKEEEEA
jgi:ABC-type amino acid transport substrate-binding protein